MTTLDHVFSHNVLPFLFSLLLAFLLFVILKKVYRIYQSVSAPKVFLELTPPAFTQLSDYATKQLFSVIHNSTSGNRVLNWLLGKKPLLSFEIVSTREAGIRYIVKTSLSQKETITRKIRSYLPSVHVREIEDYWKTNADQKLFTHIVELRLSKHFAYPLQKQYALNQHDPVAYITGMMTQLNPHELISFQLILSPVKTNEARKIDHKMLRNDDVLAYLDRPSYLYNTHLFFLLSNFVLKVIGKCGNAILWIITELVHGPYTTSSLNTSYAVYQQQLKVSNVKPMRQLSSSEEAVIKSIREKVNQPLFETTLRILVQTSSKQELAKRKEGLTASFEPFAVPITNLYRAD